MNSNRPKVALKKGAAALVGVVAVSASFLSTASASEPAFESSSRYASADFSVADARNTKLMVAVGAEDVAIAGQKPTSVRTIALDIVQTYCEVGATDVLVTRTLSSETAVNDGATVDPFAGTAAASATLSVSGTESRTPAGVGGDCGELILAASSMREINESVQIAVNWSTAIGSSPVEWANAEQGARFMYRDAAAAGTLNGAPIGPSTSGWFWSGTYKFAGTGSYTSMSPARVLESRLGLATADGQSNAIGFRPAGTVTELQVSGRAGVPVDATTAVLNIAVTGATEPGFVTVYPCGEARPTASNLNYGVGSTISNAVVAKIGINGKVCLFNYGATSLIVDVNGYFPVGAPYTSMAPARVLESRLGLATADGQSNAIGFRAAGTVTELQVSGRAGVPVDATTAVLNIAVTGATEPGFVTVYPCGEARPTASNLNYGAGSTISNAVVAKIGAGGKVCLFNYGATDLVVDVNGYFPVGAPYTSMAPARVLESRLGLATADGQSNAIGFRAAGTVTELQVSGRAGVPADATTAVLNIAVTGATEPGFVTVYPCGEARPTASNLNYGAGSTISNAVVAKIGAGGKVCLFNYGATDLIVDVNGYFPA